MHGQSSHFESILIASQKLNKQLEIRLGKSDNTWKAVDLTPTSSIKSCTLTIPCSSEACTSESINLTHTAIIYGIFATKDVSICCFSNKCLEEL